VVLSLVEYEFALRFGTNLLMKISVVHTVAWQEDHFIRLRHLGEFAYHPGYPAAPAELIERIGEAEIVIGADVCFSADVVNQCPNLAMISLWSTGYDNVDLTATRKRKIVVSNVPAYASYSVAEHTWGMALHLAKKLSVADRLVRSQHYDWTEIKGQELYQKTVGIIGLGSIGTHSAAIAKGFGCEVVACTKHPHKVSTNNTRVEFVSLTELLSVSDVILLHVPLNPETWHLIDSRAFARMQKQPILVNTSRGEIVQMAAVLPALQSGAIRAFGSDVMWTEPPEWSDPYLQQLLQMDQVVFSPHCAAHTAEAFKRLTDTCLNNVQAFLQRQPVNTVS
jgi:lactate dehydrogenase-like 2-hydroxyacid dehydrogenase